MASRDQIVALLGGEDVTASAEALIGKSILDFTHDDLQRVIDTRNAEIAVTEAEIAARKAKGDS
jgi:hypothetical protein